ncbi:hypothetical protein [Aeromonas veronii]|uniref:hypothetical protein n=1 Tax=Aeromonas veronii TaxID=654 RepID=UPI003D1BCC93
MSFEFPGYAKKGDDFAELVVDFKAFKLTGASQTEIKEVKNLIMKNIEKVKTAEFLSLKQELL